MSTNDLSSIDEFDTAADDTLTPRTTATNVYDLLTDVIRVVEAEPKRLDMSLWTDVILVYQKAKPSLAKHFPACGTVGCIAGWIKIMTRGEADVTTVGGRIRSAQDVGLAVLTGYASSWDIPRSAPEEVSVMHDAINRLFLTTDIPGKVGTKRYAQSVVSRIRKIQKKWEIPLRARAVTPWYTPEPATPPIPSPDVE